jgi:hypothetical protein
LLKGTIEVSNYYNFGYRDVEQSHYSFDIIDSTQRHCYAYMERPNADNLRQQLLAAGRPLKGVFSVALLSHSYDQGNRPMELLLELLDYRLEQ